MGHGRQTRLNLKLPLILQIPRLPLGKISRLDLDRAGAGRKSVVAIFTLFRGSSEASVVVSCGVTRDIFERYLPLNNITVVICQRQITTSLFL